MANSNRQNNNRSRAAFTLVELLLVVAIIGVLASLALAVVAGAQNEARRSATVARLGQIRAMMLDRIESYEFRRVPVSLRRFKVGGDGSGPLDRDEMRRVKNRIIADMINVEMPREILGDGRSQPVAAFPSVELFNWLNEILGRRTMDDPPFQPCAVALADALRDQRSMISDRLNALITSSPLKRFLVEPSEGLWFCLLTTDVDGTSGVDALGSRAFVINDADQFMSVVDSWNDPIGFKFYVLNNETGDLYRDPDDVPPPGEPKRPFELHELIGIDKLSDETVRIEIQNIVMQFETNNPL